MKILITGLLLLLSVCTLQAQNVERITLEDAVQIALENNYQLKQASNELDLTQFRELSAKADFLPSLNGNASRSRTIGRQFDETTGAFGDFTINSFNAGISSNLTVFNGFANINSLRAARYETLSQEEQLRRVREVIIFQTASSYLQYLLNRELLQIARENLETAERQLEQVEAQVEVGSRPTVDLLNQQSIVANSELQVLNRENNLNSSRLNLINQMQVDPQINYEFVAPDVDDLALMPVDYSLQDLISAALENRSDLKSEESRINAIERYLQVARANYYPSLTLSGSLSSRWSDINPLSFDDQFTDQNISRQFGLTLSIPIFNRLNVRENVRAQEVNFRNARLSFEDTRLGIIQEVNQAYDDYQARVKELEAAERAFIASERAFETENQRYEIGASTLIELSQANAAFVEAQSNRVQAMYSFVFQERLLDYYIGRLGDTELELN